MAVGDRWRARAERERLEDTEIRKGVWVVGRYIQRPLNFTLLGLREANRKAAWCFVRLRVSTGRVRAWLAGSESSACRSTEEKEREREREKEKKIYMAFQPEERLPRRRGNVRAGTCTCVRDYVREDARVI